MLPTTAYRRHDRLSVFAHYVTEWHLSALVRVCSNLWVIDILDLLDWNCALLVAAPHHRKETRTSVLNANSCDAHSGVGCHLNRAESTAFIAFLAQFRGSV